MKKLFLLFAAGSIAMNVGAQERHLMVDGSRIALPGDHVTNASAARKNFMAAHAPSGSHKTTAGGARWYNYGVYLDGKTANDMAAGVGADYIYGYDLPIWNDTFGYAGTRHLNMVSIGNILQPQFAGFNDVTIFSPTSMKVSPNDAYTVDSVVVPGFYFYGTNSSASVVDTLRLAFIKGDGTTPASSSIYKGQLGTTGHYANDFFYDVPYDSAMNRGAGYVGGAAPQYMDILLHNSDTGNTENVTARQIVDASGAPAPISVPKGNFIACTITFKSGQPGIFNSLPGDTIIGAVAPYTRYNVYRPMVNYYTLTDPATTAGNAPAADWAPYNFAATTPNQDFNTGLFKTLPNNENGWGDTYVPNWAFFAGSGAADLQYPEVGYHITCATCDVIPLATSNTTIVNKITATPNPATNELNVTFSLAKASDVSVSLTNVIGQVVATQNINNTINGKATFNTAALPSGVYVYTLKANGEQTTGRVVVAH